MITSGTTPPVILSTSSFFIWQISATRNGVSGKLRMNVLPAFSSTSEAKMEWKPAILKPRLMPPHPENKSMEVILLVVIATCLYAYPTPFGKLCYC